MAAASRADAKPQYRTSQCICSAALYLFLRLNVTDCGTSHSSSVPAVKRIFTS
jgi:hypothetical protein